MQPPYGYGANVGQSYAPPPLANVPYARKLGIALAAVGIIGCSLAMHWLLHLVDVVTWDSGPRS